MSRSYRKHPIVVQDKEDKKSLNRKIRRDKDAVFKTPGAFKRHRPHEGWKYIWTEDQAITDYYGSAMSPYIQDRYETLEEWLEYWRKCAYRK